MQPNLQDITQLYSLQRDYHIKVYPILEPTFKQFSYVVNRLMGKILYDFSSCSKENEYFLKPLKHYRWLCSTLPIPFNDDALIQEIFDADNFKQMQEHLSEYYQKSALAKDIQLIPELLEVLWKSATPAPLRRKMAGIVEQTSSKKRAFVLHLPNKLAEKDGLRSKLYQYVEREVGLLYGLGYPIKVISSSELAKRWLTFDEFIIFGAADWMPLCIKAPRAKTIHVIRYNWLRDINRLEPAFDTIEAIHPLPKSFEILEKTPFNPQTHQEKRKNLDADKSHKQPATCTSSPSPVQEDISAHEHKAITEETISLSDMIPRIDWESLHDRANQLEGKLTTGAKSHLTVKATIIQLINEQYTYLNCDAKVYALDSAQAEPSIEELDIAELEPDMFLLLRTEKAEKSYLSAVSDTFGGEAIARAQKLRENYTKLFNREVQTAKQAGRIEQLIKKLKRYGAKDINRAAIMRWASKDNIKSQNKENFAAIMRYINLEEETDDYWYHLDMLANTNRQAGRSIQNSLERHVQHRKSDWKHLTPSDSCLDFNLPEGEGGTISLLRILDISEDSYEIPASRVARVFSTKDLRW